MLVFKALLTQHMGDILNGTSTYVSTKQINEFLKKNGVHSDNYEVQIRKTVNKIRIFLKNKTPLQLIISENWKGYKINPDLFIGMGTSFL